MATYQTIPLDKKKIMKKTLESTAGLFIIVISTLLIFVPILSIVPGVVDAWFWAMFYWSIAGLLVIWVIAYLYQRSYYYSYSYDVRPDVLMIKKGVFTPRETSMPYKKINDVYVDMDLLDRMFGLRYVHVATASEVSAPIAHIDGVSPENADKLRDLILHKIKG
jgi:membrane protein YdbS with pleckstrin-like domain